MEVKVEEFFCFNSLEVVVVEALACVTIIVFVLQVYNNVHTCQREVSCNQEEKERGTDWNGWYP